ncbi:MAG: hypothetical protein M1165_01630, partial [Candidatus Pacearchaeota archaeon]|nr:hypothetical protein [Candidatus Pacearchaeota archaeon]
RVIKIIIKKSGDFTNLLEMIKEGDKVTLEGPYGRFNFRNFENKNQVWIAAGIGISPFLGMIEELKENPDYRVELFYTFSENKIINQHYLKIIQETENLRFVPWNSRKRGHLKLKDITNSDMNLKDKEILICGPLAFKEEIIKRLKELRINKDKIHEEVFELK